MNGVPLNGTIPRCPHSVYEPKKPAWGCGFCNPLLYEHISTPMREPVFERAARSQSAGLPKANGNYVRKSACPKCGSVVHYVLEGGRWECAEEDCKMTWKGSAQ